MRYFFTLLRLRLQLTVRSTAFAVMSGFVLTLTLLLAAVLPQGEPSAFAVGILSADPQSEAAMQMLTQNTDYDFISYTDREAMEQDVLMGGLHCAYLFTKDMPPVTVLETKASYMRPLLDEIVLAAFLEAQMPAMAADYLEQAGFDGTVAASNYERIRIEAVPMTITLQTIGDAPSIEQISENSIQPLLYAVLASVFLISSLLCVLLTSGSQNRAQQHLAVFSKHRFATAFAPVLADVLLNTIVLMAADLLMNAFVTNTVYSTGARLFALLALAVVSSLISLAAVPLRRCCGVVTAMIPPALLIGIFCSGAIVNPLYLPAGLGVLRFLSPAWYFLTLMGGLS